MVIRWIGAALVLASGGGFGFTAALQHRRQEAALEELVRAIEFLASELNCRLTPLPELCMDVADQTNGAVSRVFLRLSEELDKQLSPDADICMQAALRSVKGIPDVARENLSYLGKNLGRFDLAGQLAGFESVKQTCLRDLAGLQSNRDSRLRSYQALGFCAGAALVILLI